MKDLIEKKLKEIRDHLQFQPIEDDRELAELLTLGDKWDRPDVLVQAMDQHPEWEARYTALLRDHELARDEAKAKLDFFTSQVKERLETLVFEENINKGMTANNAKPTAAKINNIFNITIANGDEDNPEPFEWIYDDKQDRIDKVLSTYGKMAAQYQILAKAFNEAEVMATQLKIIVKAFQQRKDMLISISSLVKSLVDNGLISLRKVSRKNQPVDEDGFIG